MGGEADGDSAAGRAVVDNRWAVSEAGAFTGDEEDDACFGHRGESTVTGH